MSAATVTCPSWCVVGEGCNCDHWSGPGSEQWPGVRATGWPESETPNLIAFPTWGEIDGLAPAVAFHMEGGRYEHTIDMTPSEARQLAARLIAAAEAVERG